jgi:MFS family permease
MYTVTERARVQGYLSSVWGIASVIGPTLGGLFSQYLTWRLIFYVNLPVGAVAVWMLAKFFTERVQRGSHEVDYLGAVLLTGGFSLLTLGLLEGGVAWGWASAATVVIFASSLVMLSAVIFVERRAAEPMLPLWVFGRRVLAVRIGFRDTALIGAVLCIVGAVLTTVLLQVDSSVWDAAVAAFVLGLGLGLLASATVVAVQSVVGWEQRGVVTGANMFSRSLGSAIGAAAFGAIANATLASRLAHPPAALAGQVPHSLDASSLALDGKLPAQTPAVTAFLRECLQAATQHVFLAHVFVAVVAVGALVLMPRRLSSAQLTPAEITPCAATTGE